MLLMTSWLPIAQITRKGSKKRAAKTVFWCEKNTHIFLRRVKDTRKKDFDTYTHSTGALRILGAFSNSAQFSKDWSCPKVEKTHQ